MATYKLIQDIEAEDHILGPLSLRQFIFALVAVFLFYINFVLLTKGAAFLLIIFLPPALFCGFFAVPFGRDQPTEIWALAKLRFWFKPRQRVWNQSGVKELVTITAPKKVERILTNGLDQTEVKSRLSALANTIDSRGWAIKNVDYNAFAVFPQSSDRLIDISAMPQTAPATEAYAADDIMDATNSPIARQFDTMITQASQAHRQQLMAQLNDTAVSPSPSAGQPASQPMTNNWFANQAQTASPVTPVNDAEAEAKLSEQLAERSNSSHVSLGNMHKLAPVSDQPTDVSTTTADDQKTDAQSSSSSVTSSGDPAILSLANNNDLNVSTLAREAHKAKGDDEEVVVSLR